MCLSPPRCGVLQRQIRTLFKTEAVKLASGSDLRPGETRHFRLRFRLPQGLHPTFRGSSIRFSYSVDVRAVYHQQRPGSKPASFETVASSALLMWPPYWSGSSRAAADGTGGGGSGTAAGSGKAASGTHSVPSAMRQPSGGGGVPHHSQGGHLHHARTSLMGFERNSAGDSSSLHGNDEPPLLDYQPQRLGVKVRFHEAQVDGGSNQHVVTDSSVPSSSSSVKQQQRIGQNSLDEPSSSKPHNQQQNRPQTSAMPSSWPADAERTASVTGPRTLLAALERQAAAAAHDSDTESDSDGPPRRPPGATAGPTSTPARVSARARAALLQQQARQAVVDAQQHTLTVHASGDGAEARASSLSPAGSSGEESATGLAVRAMDERPRQVASSLPSPRHSPLTSSLGAATAASSLAPRPPLHRAGSESRGPPTAFSKSFVLSASGHPVLKITLQVCVCTDLGCAGEGSAS